MSNSTDEKFIAYWSEKRKLGKNKYGLLHGVVYFAMPAFVCSELIKNLFQIGNYELSIARFVIGFIVWSLLGFYLFRLFQWRTQENRFNQLQKKEGQ
jgi:predicted permease